MNTDGLNGFDPGDPESRDLGALFMEKTFRDLVESGEIEVSDKSPQEILNEFRILADRPMSEMPTMVTDEESNLHVALLYSSTLLGYAKREADEGDEQMAVIFYALWIEHTVNGCLARGLRRKGYGPDVIKPLIRELSLRTKMTALWHVAGFPPLSDENMLTADQITQARNSFVPYKQLRRILGRLQDLDTAFNTTMNALYWNGREDEIMASFRERWG